jgi:hypothetical protein
MLPRIVAFTAAASWPAVKVARRVLHDQPVSDALRNAEKMTV